MVGTRGPQGGTKSVPTLNLAHLVRLPKHLPGKDDFDDEGEDDFDPVLPKACCDPIQIIWWYKSIGSDDYGIHVNWDKWEDEYNKLKPISNETIHYFHEYFHHVCDTWKTKHGLRDEALVREYERIWTNEDQKKQGYTKGILLGEALAEWFAEKRQESIRFIKKKQHPSYSVQMGGWEWCSLYHVYQILNNKYEIFKQPMDSVVADRKLISDLNKDYEEFEDELYSVKMGFRLDDSVYEYAKDSPQTIPFYVHGQGQKENWESEVQEFCKQNNLAKPIFVH